MWHASGYTPFSNDVARVPDQVRINTPLSPAFEALQQVLKYAEQEPLAPTAQSRTRFS